MAVCFSILYYQEGLEPAGRERKTGSPVNCRVASVSSRLKWEARLWYDDAITKRSEGT